MIIRQLKLKSGFKLISFLFLIGLFMTSWSIANTKLENFDNLFVGHPSEIEKNLRDLLPEAQALENKSIYLQILSQIALAEAMQKKFDLAHKTLDHAEANLSPEYELAHVRILLERGRVFHQSDDTDAALPFFEQSYFLSAKHEFDFQTINAAHMVAIAVKNIAEKIKWNKMAIDLAQKAEDKRAQTWLGALYNNLAQNYIEAQQYNEAYCAFEQSKKFGEESEHVIVVRGAKWGIARSLRSLGHLDEALSIQLALLEEYQTLAEKDELAIELIVVGRGLVYEELAEIHQAYMKKFSALAYEDLSQNPWFAKLEPKRLEKMKQHQEESKEATEQ